MSGKVSGVLGYCLLLILLTAAPSQGIGEDAILNFLEAWRGRMCHSIPRLGFPAIDPLHINHTERHFNNKYLIDFDAELEDLTLKGISQFQIDKLKISTLPFRRSSLAFSLPVANLATNLNAAGNLGYFIDVAGNGGVKGSLQNLTVSASWAFRASLNAQIRNLEIEIKIGAITVDLKNLATDRLTDFTEALINELGLELINDLWTLRSENVVNILETFINRLLGNFGLTDIIALLGQLEFTAEDPPADC